MLSKFLLMTVHVYNFKITIHIGTYKKCFIAGGCPLSSAFESSPHLVNVAKEPPQIPQESHAPTISRKTC